MQQSGMESLTPKGSSFESRFPVLEKAAPEEVSPIPEMLPSVHSTPAPLRPIRTQSSMLDDIEGAEGAACSPEAPTPESQTKPAEVTAARQRRFEQLKSRKSRLLEYSSSWEARWVCGGCTQCHR